jgi:hypothetical protein
VSPVNYEFGFYIPEDDILHSHRRENLKSYIPVDPLICLYTVTRRWSPVSVPEYKTEVALIPIA